MKKLFLMIVSGVILFGANDADINKKLNFILKRMSQLEKKIDSKDKEIQNLKTELKKQKIETKKEFTISNCSNIKVKDFKYTYNKQITPRYFITFTLLNKYPYDITKISGKLLVRDKDNIILLTDFIDKTVALSKNGTITINRIHTVDNDLEKSMAKEPLETLKITFTPSTIVFKNGRRANCGSFLGSIF